MKRGERKDRKDPVEVSSSKEMGHLFVHGAPRPLSYNP